jgi:ABC-type Na+ efflux pump permease subunit
MMGRHWLGPVFAFDLLSMARRWQIYASRAGFVSILLVGMTITWMSSGRAALSPGGVTSIAQLAEIGAEFFYALAAIQLAFILLAAPASAAGSICVDRSRGTLLHMMVTDLSDREIVLGRLGSRLVPVFGLVACGLPVLALAGLLGGIDFGAMVGLFAVSIALAILGCSLALAISIKASKTHEVLMAVYMAFGVWLLVVPIWWILTSNSPPSLQPPDWFANLNPFVLVFAPYDDPDNISWIDFAIFLGVVLGISLLLVGWSVLRLRRAVVDSTGRTERVRKLPRWIGKLRPSFPGPTLDGNPVLWREWHRNRPSRLARWLWLGLFVVTGGIVAWGTYAYVNVGFANGDNGLQLGFMIQLFFGLLMVAASSPTVLAEERSRGSLDILLSTPLSTRSIVLAKWWGAYRRIFGLAILPIFLAIFLATVSPDIPTNTRGFRWPTPPTPLTIFDRYCGAFCLIGDFLVSAALIVSIGVLLATWVTRIGRAISASVFLYFLLGVGLPILLEMSLTNQPIQVGGQKDWQSQTFREAVPALSPAFGPIVAVDGLSGWQFHPRGLLWKLLGAIILIKLTGTLLLLGLTLWSFNNRLSRVAESRPPTFRAPSRPERLPKPGLVALDLE